MASEITIQVEEINNTLGGNIVAMLFSKDGFPKEHEKAIARQIRQASTSKVKFTFENNGYENLAIKIHHDENGDTRVTKNWTGIIPKEGLGFSNGGRIGLFGPPSYTECVLDHIDLSSPITIKMRYP